MKLTKLAEKLEKVVQGAAEQSKRNIVLTWILLLTRRTLDNFAFSTTKVFPPSHTGSSRKVKKSNLQRHRKFQQEEKLLFIFGPEEAGLLTRK